MHDRLQMQLLGRDQRESLRQIEAHLPAEHAARTGAGAVGFLGAALEHVLQEIEIRTHDQAFAGTGVNGSVGARRDSRISHRPITTSGSDCSWPIVTQPKAR